MRLVGVILQTPRLQLAMTKRDLTIFQRFDAIVGDGRSKDVAAEILERGHAIADGFDIAHELAAKGREPRLAIGVGNG